MRVWLILILLIFLSPVLLFAQGDGVEPTKMEYIALMFNVGIVATVVQLIKWKGLPWLKKSAPYLIPVLSLVIGIGGAWVLTQTGIDISPIGDIFSVGILSGAMASSGFAVVKEIDNKRKRR